MKVAGKFKFKDFMNFKVTKSVLKISYILVEHRNPASFLLFLAFIFLFSIMKVSIWLVAKC